MTKQNINSIIVTRRFLFPSMMPCEFRTLKTKYHLIFTLDSFPALALISWCTSRYSRTIRSSKINYIFTRICMVLGKMRSTWFVLELFRGTISPAWYLYMKGLREGIVPQLFLGTQFSACNLSRQSPQSPRAWVGAVIVLAISGHCPRILGVPKGLPLVTASVLV